MPSITNEARKHPPERSAARYGRGPVARCRIRASRHRPHEPPEARRRPHGCSTSTYESGIFQVRGGSTTQYRMAMLAVAGDVDNNGTLDLFSGTYVDPTQPTLDTGDRSEILLNDGTGHFTLAPISDPHPGPTDLWPTTGATFADVDRDGKLDLFVGFWYADYGFAYQGVQAQLYKGAGDGTFSTVTVPSNLTTAPDGFAEGWNHRPSYGVTSCDLDGDGSPELMVSAYGRQWNLLYQNDGTGRFIERGQASGYAADSDLHYQDNQFFACYCTVHTTEADCAGVGTPLISCPAPADADWAHGIDDQPWRLGGNRFHHGLPRHERRLAEPTCTVRGSSTGTSVRVGTPPSSCSTRPTPACSRSIACMRSTAAMQVPHPTSDWNEGLITAAAVDLDNDGRPDMVVGATDYPDQFGLLFHQKPDGTFEEVGQNWGFHHACVSGLAVADFDRDGDLDIVVGSGTARDCSLVWKTNEVHIYENNASQNGRWLAVRLKRGRCDHQHHRHRCARRSRWNAGGSSPGAGAHRWLWPHGAAERHRALLRARRLPERRFHPGALAEQIAQHRYLHGDHRQPIHRATPG